MQLSYNVTGPERKKLVSAISQFLNAPMNYLGAPSFAYEVGDYHIDKTGTVTGPDNRELAEALAEPHGFVSLTGEYDEDTADGQPAIDVEPMSLFDCAGADAVTEPPAADGELETEAEDGHQPDEVAQEAAPAQEPSDEPQETEGPQEADAAAQEADPEAWAEREMRRMRLERENVPDYSNLGPYGGDDYYPEWAGDGHQPDEVSQEAASAREPSDEPQETESPQDGETAAPEAEVTPDDITTIEVPLAGFTLEALENLNRMVTAKAALLTAAIGTEALPIIRKAETVAFPWFPADADAEHIQAYTTLVAQLSKTAKEKKRVNAKAKDTEGSPKYAMRCFLLGIGMIGPEFKDARKILLTRLSGSSSFCSKASEERWKAKHTGPKAETAAEIVITVAEAGESEVAENE